MLKFILGLPVDAACQMWLVFRWLVLSPGLYMQETIPVRLLLVRMLAIWAAACTLPSLLPLPVALFAVAVAGPLVATGVTALQALAQFALSGWRSSRY